MENLIKALTILSKYADPNDKWPTHCEHDVLYVYAGINPENVSEEDIKELDDLGFIVDERNDCFMSYRYGSC